MSHETDLDKPMHGGVLRHLLGLGGVAAACVLIAVSAAMNWRFGYSLGRSELDGMIYGAASAAADCLKALVPFFFFGALRRRQWSQAVAAAVVGLVVTAYSLASAFGHAAQNRNDTTGQRAVEAATYKSLQSDLKRAEDQLSWIPPHRPVAMVKGEIESLKVQRSWTATEDCRRFNGRAAREFCGKYHELVAELGSGEEAASLSVRITELQGKLARFEGTPASGDADPQAALIARLLGLDVGHVQLGLAIFVAILLEVGSGMGLYVALSQWRVDEPRGTGRASMRDITPGPLDQAREIALLEQPGNLHDARLPYPADAHVHRFCDDRVRRAAGRTTSVTSLYESYRLWCTTEHERALALPAFVRAMDELGFERGTTGIGVQCLGIALADGIDGAVSR